MGLKWGLGGTPSVPELPQILRDVPQISQAAKQHLTFAALKEYDSREADGENRESGKRGGRGDKSHTKCRLPPKQLVCNHRHSSLPCRQFDSHLSDEALISG